MSFWAEQNTEKKGLRTIKPYAILSVAEYGKERFKNNKTLCILSGAEYGKERFKNNKALCHSERSEVQPKNLAVGAFIISLRFAGFLGKPPEWRKRLAISLLWGIITVAESRSLIMTVRDVNCALNYKSNEKPASFAPLGMT